MSVITQLTVDEIRDLRAQAARLEARATELGPSSEAAWILTAAAASLERRADLLELELAEAELP